MVPHRIYRLPSYSRYLLHALCLLRNETDLKRNGWNKCNEYPRAFTTDPKSFVN